MMSLNTQVAAFGATDEDLEPPDTQVAAGPSYLLEAVNDTISVWSKTGTLVSDANMNTFFPVPAGYLFSDPRALYDASSGRWFVSGWALDANNDSQTYLAVSGTSDPTGSWTIYTVQSNTASTITDQPMIGVCDDKVVMAWNEYTGTGATPAYDAAQALVLDKSALVAASTSVASQEFTITDEFRLVPAQALSSTTTCWMTVNNASTDLLGSTTTPTLGVIALTGTPATGVTLTETDLAIAATTAAPAPQQPGGTVEPATSNDDRLLSAVWQNNMLWTTATVSCVPTGDTTERNCMLVDAVSTSGTLSMQGGLDLSTSGLDEYYPAVSLDGDGNLYLAYTASSTTLYPGAYAVVSPSSSLSFSVPYTIQAGSASYAGVRWGDYSAVAPDPSLPGTAWVAGEYAPSDAALPDWGTAAAEIRLQAVAPTITSANQATFTVGMPGSFTVTATGSPAPTFTESGALPAGVTFGSAGVLSGTPAAGTAGSYPIQILAQNNGGSATQAFTLTVPVVPATSPFAPAALNYSDGTIALYTIRSDGNIWSEHQTVPGGPFNGWQQLSTSGSFYGTPAVIETKSGIIGIYAYAPGPGVIMGASQTGPTGAVSAWSQIGSATDIQNSPHVLLTASGVIAIYDADSSGAIEGISQFSANSAFGAWHVLSPSEGLFAAPAVLQTKSGVIALYAITPAGTLLGTSQHVVGGAFSAWGQVGSASNLVGGPTALLTANGVIALYATDLNGAVDGISQFAPYSAFGNWQTLSPNEGFAGDPTVLQTSSGVIAIYAHTSADTILATSQSVPGGAFSAWDQLGTATNLRSDPVALIINITHVIAIFAADMNGAVAGISQSVPYGPFGPWTEM
jgi:hypothetical protein